MLGFIQGDILRRLVKECAEHFKRRGWALSFQRGFPSDLLIKKGDLSFNIALVDITGIHQKGMDQLLTEMDFLASKFHGNATLCFVVNFDIPTPLLDVLVTRSIVVVGIHELEQISSLRYDKYLVPDQLEPGQAVLLRNNPWACIHIATHCRDAGDKASSVWWSKVSLSNVFGFSGVYYQAFDLLMEGGDLDGAQKVALDGLDLHRSDSRLVNYMQRLAQVRGDSHQSKVWAQRAAEIEEQQPTVSIEQILGKQIKNVRPETNSMPKAGGFQVASTAANRRWFSLFGMFKSNSSR